MNEALPSLKLERFDSLLNDFEIRSKIGSDEIVSIRATKSISKNLIDQITDDGFVLKSAIEESGGTVRISELKEIRTGTELKLQVPRNRTSCFVADDFDDLVSGKISLRQEPKEFIVLSPGSEKSHYWSRSPDPVPSEIHSYRRIQKLTTLLESYADGVSNDPFTVTLFDVERLDIVIKQSDEIFNSRFQSEKVSEFLEMEGLSEVRKESFKTTLWDRLKHYSPEQRFSHLIKDKDGDSFLRALQYNFRVAKSDYTLSKRLESARQEHRELAGNLAKLASGLEAKAFAVPGTLLLGARFIEYGGGLSAKNLSILASSIILSVIVSIAFRTHNEITNEAKEDIGEAKKNLSDTKEDELLETKLCRLESRFVRINNLKLGVVIMACAVSVAILLMCYTTDANVLQVPTDETTNADTSNGFSGVPPSNKKIIDSGLASPDEKPTSASSDTDSANKGNQHSK